MGELMQLRYRAMKMFAFLGASWLSLHEKRHRLNFPLAFSAWTMTSFIQYLNAFSTWEMIWIFLYSARGNKTRSFSMHQWLAKAVLVTFIMHPSPQDKSRFVLIFVQWKYKSSRTFTHPANQIWKQRVFQYVAFCWLP